MSKFLSFGEDARRIAEADSVAVIGLGRFGASLALELMASGTDVLGIDDDPDIVQSLNGELTQVVRADSTRLEVLQQLAGPRPTTSRSTTASPSSRRSLRSPCTG